MSITDELRRYADNWSEWFYDDKDGGLIHAIGYDPIQSIPVPRVINDIADRIDKRADADVCCEYTRGYTTGFSEASDGIEAADELRERIEREYVKLPVDADKMPIHVGDVMEWPTTGETFEVVGISANTLFYTEHDFDDSAQWTAAHDKHHHAPTVEDVLDEFFGKANLPDGTQTRAEIIAEYAAKLRLAGDE